MSIDSGIVTAPDAPAVKRARIEHLLKRAKPVESKVPVEDEVTRFLKDIYSIGIDEDPYVWWRERQLQYSKLSLMAKVFLPIPASSAAAERVFSTAANVLQEKRRRMGDANVAKQIWLQKNLNLYNQIMKERAAQQIQML